MGQKWSSRRRRQRIGAGQSEADDIPLTPLHVNKNESLSVGAAQIDTPHAPATPTSDHQPTPSESALPPTAALSLF